MENEAKKSQMQGAGLRATEAYLSGTTTAHAGTRNAAAGVFGSFNND